MLLDDLETPAVVIDLPKVEANLARAHDYAEAHGLALRPHIKTHKLPRFALRQMELGSVGITCQKLGEAEVMVEAGLRDILIPYNLLGPAKLARLKALTRRAAISVSADSSVTVAGYAAAFTEPQNRLPVLIECDTGMGRCGVTSPEAAVALAGEIAAAPGLRYAGILTYPVSGRWQEARDRLAGLIAALQANELPPETVSSGGTPDLYQAHHVAGLVTEYRPGTYIYSDRSQVARGVGTLDDCALTVLATVVSRPTPDRIVIDAGSKVLSSDTLGLSGFGLVRDYPEAIIASLSEEHGVIDVSGCAHPPEIGDRLHIIPNHACVVSNLFDTVVLADGAQVVALEPVAARGRVT